MRPLDWAGQFVRADGGKQISDSVAEAVAILRAGGLVAFPTETVYGLGADARNPEAIRRLFAAKGRPADHPVIVHLASADAMPEWASDVPPAAVRLADAFWPGPLTLVLPRAAHVLDLVTGGQETVALRVPSHPIAHALLTAFGDGVVAPSANRFGRLSATEANHVRAAFDFATVPLVLNGGRTDVGVESTIVDLSGQRPTLLRPGAITPSQLAEVLGTSLATPTASSPRASGTLPQHYAPRTPIEIVPGDTLPSRVLALSQEGLSVAMLLRSVPLSAIKAAVGTSHPRTYDYSILPSDAAGYTRSLYSALHHLDWKGMARILVEDVPEGDAWLAVRDRLRRAAYRGEE